MGEEMDAKGSNPHIFPAGRAAASSSPAPARQNGLPALTPDFRYSQYYTINTVMGLRTGKAQNDSVQQDAYAALEQSTTGQRPIGAQMHWGSG